MSSRKEFEGPRSSHTLVVGWESQPSTIGRRPPTVVSGFSKGSISLYGVGSNGQNPLATDVRLLDLARASPKMV